MSILEFLKGLPSYNEKNFSQFNTDTSTRPTLKRAAIYLPTKEFPSEQIIVTEKTSILLKYMQQHWERRYLAKKREQAVGDSHPLSKRPRLDLNQ